MLRYPFTACVFGSTMAGKSYFVRDMLKYKDSLIDKPPDFILYAYGALNDIILEYQSDPKIQLYEGVPPLELVEKLAKQHRLLIVLDDLMTSVSSDYLNVIFTKGAHNWPCAVVYVTQHLFSKETRTIRNNVIYYVIMRNNVGMHQTKTLALQLFNKNWRFMIDAYKDACVEPYTYLLVDNHPKTEENKRLKTNIFSAKEQFLITYRPRDSL